jgi:hypothetical protein
MKVVYVSGAYRAPTPRGIVENIRKAEALAIEVWQSGAACICPHLNTALLDGTCPDDVWLKGDLAIIRKCDAMIMMDGWIGSIGAQAEKILAEELKIPVFHALYQLQNWLEAENGKKH